MKNVRSIDLEDRLVEFAVKVSVLVSDISSNGTGKYLSNQLIRSGISPALNYGEARSAESSSDFIHKMKISLKELRESFVSLKIIKKANLVSDVALLEICLTECNELIAIFVKSIQTAEQNRKSG